MRRLSARSRITLGTLVVAAVLLAIALLVVRAQVGVILSDADVSLARSDLASFEKDIAAHPDEAVDDPGTGVLVYVRDPDGTVQVNTLPHDVLELVSNEQPADEQYTTSDDDGRTFVVVGREVEAPTGTWALWSARSTSASELALEGLDRVLGVGGIILLLGFAVASWLIATLALRPVNAAAARERQMVSDAAHELRTPLSVLKTQLELAHADFGDAAALEQQVRSAEGSVTRLTALAANLLELSRRESGAQHMASTRAAALVDEFIAAVDRARLLAMEADVTVEFAVGVDDDAELYRLDAQSFGRMVDNLITNAVAAVGAAGRIDATLTQSGSRLLLVVSDDGPGVPESFLPVAFERFTRPDAARTAATGGSGLGLALVRAVARHAGGDATAENTHPGLRITVSIPKM